MTDTRRPNKNSSNEDAVGDIHKMVTTLHTLRLKQMIERIEAGGDVETVIGDGKAIEKAGIWAADKNNITCSLPEANEESELAKTLAAIKEQQGNRGARASGDTVVPFKFDDSEEQ